MKTHHHVLLNRRRWSQSIAALALVGLVAAGCGDDDSASPTTEASQAEGEADTSAILRYGADFSAGGDPYFEGAASSGNSISRAMNDMIYDTLVHEAADGGEEPGLASSWETPDDSTVILTIRDGVKFQDGTDVDADAVKFSIERSLELQPPNLSPDFATITSVEASGDTVTVKTSKPVAGILVRDQFKHNLSMSVVSPTAVEAAGDDFEANPVGAGPYALEDYKPDQLISLRSWDGYWDADNRLLAGIDFVNTQAGPPMVNALVAGDIDMGDVQVTDIEALTSHDDLTTTTKMTDASLMMPLCTNKAPFDSAEARQALIYAVDRAEINAAAFGGQGSESVLPVDETSELYSSDLAADYGYDVDRAKELLAEAGVAEGTKITVVYPQNQTEASLAGEVLQQQLKDVGLELELVPGVSFIEDLTRLGADAAILNNRLASQGNWTLAGGPVNWCGYDNPALTDALASTGTVDPDALADAWHDVEQVYLEDAPIVFLGVQPIVEGHTKKVGGITQLHPQGQGAQLRTVFVTK